MYCTYNRLFWLLAWLWAAPVLAQHTPQLSVETGVLLSPGTTPFWLRANQFGAVPLNSPLLRLSTALYAPYRQPDSSGRQPKIDWAYGAQIVANAGVANQVLLIEGYVKGRIGAFEAVAGRQKVSIGLADTLLTSGSYSWSGNALPIPKIQIGIPVFTSVPLTKGVVSVMGAFVHGWFDVPGRLSQGNLLHQLYAFGRLGKPTWPVRLHGGFTHQAVWAGYTDPKLIGDFAFYTTVDGTMPSGLKYFPYVVTGKRPKFANYNQFSSFDENRIGNHLGSIEFAADATISRVNVFAYRQFVYDDGSLFYGTNLADGLYGLRLKNLRPVRNRLFHLRQLTLEHLYTVSQGGDFFVLEEDKKRGRDDYFNNGQFIDGWTYRGQTIGTPFITAQGEAQRQWPARVGVVNNRVSLWHLGLNGILLGKYELTARLSASRNLGTYAVPFETTPGQFSGLLTATAPMLWLGGCTLSGAVGLDIGNLLPSTVGTYLSVRKSGSFGRWLGR